MIKDEAIPSTVQISMEAAIDAVRELRNEQIKVFLKDDHLQDHFKSKFNKDLTRVKLEFLRRDLQHLLIAPVDLVHYSMLIKSIKESNSVAVTDKKLVLIQQELETIFKKYLF